MLGSLLKVIQEVRPSTKSVLDPFVGSGTVLTEAMLKGMDFVGQDVNPLALLVCRAKSGPFDIQTFSSSVSEVLAQARSSRSTEILARFNNLSKWFRDDVATGLSSLRRAIRQQDALHVRRFLWVALAETVRVTSNSRLSTVKLHMRSPEDMASRKVDVIGTFGRIAQASLKEVEALAADLRSAGFMKGNEYAGTVQLRLGDSARGMPASSEKCDLLLSSPPYGDNVTTVTYGQHAYLPLQWIDSGDIDPAMGPDYLATTHEIDYRSLGGSRRVDKATVKRLSDLSPALQATLTSLPEEPKDRRARVAAFVRDLDRSLDPILGALKPDAHMVWIVGNRHVARQRIPTDSILAELLVKRGAVEVCRPERRIAAKRMAVKNATTETMTKETILVMRKGEPHAT